MHKGSRPARPNPTLQNVKWRFLSDAALGPTAGAPAYPDDSRKRILHLERALASTHDLEAQYQSFLQEVSKIDPSGTTFDGVGPGWAGVPSVGPSTSADIIPSDPDDSAFGLGGAGGIAKNAFGGGSAAALSTSVPTAESDANAEGAEHVDEDDEVARVQQLAAAAAADEGEDPLRNSPSPVIIWRHAAPVKIATNVPADLLAPTGADGGGVAVSSPSLGGGGMGGGGMGGGLSTPAGGRSRAGGGGARPRMPLERGGASGGAPQPRFVNPARAAFDRRMAYGVWYLPKEQWEQRAQAAGAGALASSGMVNPAAAAASGGGGGGGTAGGSTAGGDKAAEGGGKGGKGGRRDRGNKGGDANGNGEEGEGQSPADQIPTLYSSRIYKDYLKAQRVPATRIPPYLQRVESPKAQLSSRRGNIPMIEGAEPDSP